MQGECKTKRCGYRKNGHQCGPGCQCLNCENLPIFDAFQLEFNDIEIAAEVEVRNDPESESECESLSESDTEQEQKMWQRD